VAAVLIRFEVANFRSIFDPVELSLVAVDRDRPEARAMPNLGESLLPVAAVYGPNASGKSNLIEAMNWLQTGISDSVFYWEDGIPVEPFEFNDGDPRPTEFAVEMMINNVRFEYVLELDRKAVHYEALFHYPEKKRRRVFEREGDDLKFQRGLGRLSGTRELLTSRTLALSVARRFDEPLVADFAKHIEVGSAMGLRSGRQRPQIYDVVAAELFSADATPADRGRALALLRLADLGIEDVLIDRERISYTSDGSVPGHGRQRVRLIHRAPGRWVPLDFGQESEGTRTWFRLIYPVLNALDNGAVLLFDELDASLHPTLSAQLIRLFHDPATNPRGAQLIFSSHDTSLLNHLNRDEVWLTEKARDGSTRLGALAEFAGERVRKGQNIERAYLHGRFGALPDTDRTEMLRALGLIG
jgi:uncharacterized protein